MARRGGWLAAWAGAAAASVHGVGVCGAPAARDGGPARSRLRRAYPHGHGTNCECVPRLLALAAGPGGGCFGGARGPGGRALGSIAPGGPHAGCGRRASHGRCMRAVLTTIDCAQRCPSSSPNPLPSRRWGGGSAESSRTSLIARPAALIAAPAPPFVGTQAPATRRRSTKPALPCVRAAPHARCTAHRRGGAGHTRVGGAAH